uniref:hypothetical protein n=1 Tax=Escherichia coli TaxID=562 RepID=UPI001BC83712
LAGGGASWERCGRNAEIPAVRVWCELQHAGRRTVRKRSSTNQSAEFVREKRTAKERLNMVLLGRHKGENGSNALY